MKKLIEVQNVTRKYRMGTNTVKALDNVSLTINEGEIIVILGPSGSGKTTFLNVISGLDLDISGKVLYEGIDISKYNDYKITKFRKKKVGFIFQTYNLLEHLNVYENILIGKKLGKNNINIDDIIDTVGLTKHQKKYVHQLSGGEQQRVSIARALAKNPQVLFGDEPTGALDEKTGKEVLNSLISANARFKTTMIIVTHNPGIALIGDLIIKMNSGKIIETTHNERINPKDIPWG